LTDYVGKWREKMASVVKQLQESCPDVEMRFLGPSFAWDHYAAPGFEPVEAFGMGLNIEERIRELSIHK
jgi:hypothetical protein